MTESENLVQLVNRLLLEKHYDGILVLMQDPKNTPKLKEIFVDVIEICKAHLTEENFKENSDLYYCCEDLLTIVAKFGSQEGVLFELLEIIETTDSDQVLTTTLKALQIVLLQQKDNKSRSLEWSLGTIKAYLEKLPYPKYLAKGYDEKEEKLIEQDDQVLRILTLYYTLFLFYEPICKELSSTKDVEIFKNTKLCRRNVLTSFLLELLDRPLCLLNLEKNEEHPTNLYAYNCAKRLVEDVTSLLRDPLSLLQTVEQRIRWKPKFKNEEQAYEAYCQNMFLSNEKISLIALGSFYYLQFYEGISVELAPKVYSKSYIFESGLYLVVEMLKAEEPPIHKKGLLLAHSIADLLKESEIPASSLELDVHSNFCESLSKVAIFSENFNIRKISLVLFKKYIYRFEDKGRFMLIKNLMTTVTHNGLLGHIYILYKNLISEKLSSPEDIPTYVSFEELLLKPICHLNDKVETDLMENTDKIISSLNFIRYFALQDLKNKTKFWNQLGKVESIFLKPLRTAIDMSRAHYKAEYERVKNNVELPPPSEGNQPILEVTLPDGSAIDDINKQQKLDMLTQAHLTFDLMDSLLARVNECIDQNRKKI